MNEKIELDEKGKIKNGPELWKQRKYAGGRIGNSVQTEDKNQQAKLAAIQAAKPAGMQALTAVVVNIKEENAIITEKPGLRIEARLSYNFNGRMNNLMIQSFYSFLHFLSSDFYTKMKIL